MFGEHGWGSQQTYSGINGSQKEIAADVQATSSSWITKTPVKQNPYKIYNETSIKWTLNAGYNKILEI